MATASLNRVTAVLDRVAEFERAQKGIQVARRGYDSVRTFVDSRRRPEPAVEGYVAGVTPLRRMLMRPAILGFLASVAILAGASQQNSPFTFKQTGSWFFGIPAPSDVQGLTQVPGQGLFLGVIAIYAGMLLLLAAWYDIVRVTSQYRGIPVARLVPIFVAWLLPLMVVAPLFSRDVYSYVAQGEMMTHHINPYSFGPSVLGNASPFNLLVDPLWRNVPSPYGPAFLMIAGSLVSVTGHNVLVSIVAMRLVALAGVIAFSVGVVIIARSFNRDGATAYALAAMNPLILLHLVAGAHNDALMLGLLVLGYALARQGRPIVGIILCGLAAAVKVPALIGAIYIGWEWLGSGKTPRERLRPVVTALVISIATMTFLSETARLGWGWIAGLSNPDAVRSWLDPATGIALTLGKIVSLVGLGNHTHTLLTLMRGGALLLAAVIAVVLLLRSEEIGPLRALGWTLVALVVLGPVIQPWYATWGFVFLAPIAEGRVRRWLVIVSGIACYLGLPGGRVLIDEITIANPFLVAFMSAALILLGVAIIYPRVRRYFTPFVESELVSIDA